MTENQNQTYLFGDGSHVNVLDDKVVVFVPHFSSQLSLTILTRSNSEPLSAEKGGCEGKIWRKFECGCTQIEQLLDEIFQTKLCRVSRYGRGSCWRRWPTPDVADSSIPETSHKFNNVAIKSRNPELPELQKRSLPQTNNCKYCWEISIYLMCLFWTHYIRYF